MTSLPSHALSEGVVIYYICFIELSAPYYPTNGPCMSVLQFILIVLITSSLVC